MNSDEQSIRLILADIDGTLVNEAREMEPLTRRVLQHLHRKGILFGIASGRPCDELPATIAGYELGFEPDFIVGMNGGELYEPSTGSLHVMDQLNEASIQKAIELMKPFEQVNPVIYRDHLLVCRFRDDLILQSEKHSGKKSRIVETDSEFWQSPTGKIMFRTQTPEECEDIEAFAKARLDPSFSAFRTQPTLLEVQDHRMNKGVALRTICQKSGLDPACVAAFGDASNDNEMLQAAGLGVCLLNGLPDTKASADEITRLDNDHEGMARYLLERFPGWFADFEESADRDRSV